MNLFSKSKEPTYADDCRNAAIEIRDKRIALSIADLHNKISNAVKQGMFGIEVGDNCVHNDNEYENKTVATYFKAKGFSVKYGNWEFGRGYFKISWQ